MSLNVLRAFRSVHLPRWPGGKNARERFHPRLGLDGEPPADHFYFVTRGESRSGSL
jgi:hypothetical protein